MKKVTINEKIEIIYVDSYKQYNKENCYYFPNLGNRKTNNEKSKKFQNLVNLFGFMMYWW